MVVLGVRYSVHMGGFAAKPDMERADLLHMASLRRDGVLTSRPVQVACFVDTPTLDAARQAGREARACGWHVDVHLACDDEGWVMQATRIMRLDWDAVVDMRATMVAIAQRASGEYDGWGMSPIEP